MEGTLRLHEQVQWEIELHDSIYHRKVFYPQYGKEGLYVTVFTEHLKPGTIWEKYIDELNAYLERTKDTLSDFSIMTIIGNSRFVE